MEYVHVRNLHGVENMNRDDLKQVIKDHAIKRQTVVLSSGKTSDIYYDIRELMSDPVHMSLVAEVFLDKIRGIDNIKSIGGLATGSISIACAVQYHALRDYKLQLNTFYVRKNRKKYGLQKQVEGMIKPPVAIIDDVLYSGTSISIALTELDKINVPVSAVIPLIFRGDEKKLQEAHDMFGKLISPIFMEDELL